MTNFLDNGGGASSLTHKIQLWWRPQRPFSTSENQAISPQGFAAIFVSLFLIWYAAWTIICNAAVLSGAHYAAIFPQTLIIPTLLVAAATPWVSRMARERYKDKESLALIGGFTPQWWLAVALAAGSTTILIVADQLKHGSIASGGSPRLTQVATGLCVVTTLAVAWFISFGPKNGLTFNLSGSSNSWWRLIALIILVFGIYYFGHRQDEDESNFINLALGAQRTHGGIFSLDTMIGDGPHAIHLPTYKFHSFELLSASLSSLFHIEPIYVAHLMLPAPQLVLISMIAWLLLEPVVGKLWLASSIFLLGFQFFATEGYSTWGLHGLPRLFEGKAFLVTALVPLIAGMTIRWFQHGNRTDLLLLGTAQICAIGFSANGLYVGPSASAFVACAFLIAKPSIFSLQRASALLLTLIYPAIMAVIISLTHLAFPSEILVTGQPLAQLLSVSGNSLFGMLVLTFMMLLAMGLAHTPIFRPAIAYVPFALIATLNPLSWKIISGLTGNLGFRIFWALPIPMMAGILATLTLLRAKIRSEAIVTTIAALTLVAGIAFNALLSSTPFKVHWHLPTLKVNADQYGNARLLAKITGPGCAILAPEVVSQWLSTIEGAAYPVFTRRLYLVHYRFTMPPRELRAREQLADLVEKPAIITATPDLRQLLIPIGTIAVAKTIGPIAAADSLARQLNLKGPFARRDLLVWTGTCAKL
ncbi:DUF6077 domain-containing protein [Sphingomonas paeninsulae]|uniref:DUF6077 domain-containing protein n=1 Tax=Sphingomonas paeninsulae TaxID=2319844 RepID=UPI0013CEF15D|nr:DUF6077 domain-containing protein [Sphingomonas paeninsulae]